MVQRSIKVMVVPKDELIGLIYYHCTNGYPDQGTAFLVVFFNIFKKYNS